VGKSARSGRLGEGRRRGDDGGFSMVVVAISMVVVAALVLLVAKATLGASGSSNGSVAGNPEVALAADVQAQQSLTTALGAVSDSGVGGDGGVSGAGIAGISGSGAGGAADTGSGGFIAHLSAAEPSLTFVPGPTTSATTVSVASDSSVPGEMTLATRSSDGVCWLVWHAPGAATWFGAQTHVASCIAPALGSPPTPGPVSSTAIGWQTTTFPSA
jgi:hypothetical protein